MSNRMAGHTLVAEGAPHNMRGTRWHNLYNYTTGGTGYGKCSCGKLSPLLHSSRDRKKWHREHKEELRKESQK